MRGYPYDPPPGGGPAGRVRLLTDADGGGTFEDSRVFADRLHWPSGIACWRGGIFVTAAPDILYLKDTSGDGVADVRRVVFTGFGTEKSEDIVNNLKWGLDHWIYGTTSYNGGSVRHAERGDQEPVDLRGLDFRFHPVSETFEAVGGTGGDFGNSFDAWGNRFASNAGMPVIHAVFPLRLQHPTLGPARLAQQAFESDGRVFPISRPEPWRVTRKDLWDRWVDTTHDMRARRFPFRELAIQGYLTGAAAVSIYRGAAYPDPYRGNAFTGEPAGNLVIRSVLERDGATFRASRADGEREFIASSDTWFRPVNFVNGPDGCLYMLDMYREVIEDPSAIPEDILEYIDYYSGQDRGRIYRIVYRGWERGQAESLAGKTADELADALEHPNGWHRETAHRLLFERQHREISGRLKALAASSPSPSARLHALWLLDGLELLDAATLIKALDDAHAAVRENALRLAEPRLPESRAIQARVLSRAEDPDAAVRFRAALALAAHESISKTSVLARAIKLDPDDAWLRAAAFSATSGDSMALFEDLVGDRDYMESPASLVSLKRLAGHVGGGGASAQILALLRAVRRQTGADQAAVRLGVFSGIAEGMAGSESDLLSLQVAHESPALRRVILESFREAREVAGGSAGVSEESRSEAIRILGWAPYEIAVNALVESISPEEPSAIQLAAVRSLSMHEEPAVGQLLVERWRTYSPALRREVAEALFSRDERLVPLLDALESEEIPITHLEPGRRATLRDHPRPEVRQRARKLLSDAGTPQRQELLAAYRPALAAEGNAARGQEAFQRECATCHRLAGGGHSVGPDLSEVSGQSPTEMLTHILDPNAKVQSNYINYRLDTRDGQVLTGIIARETGYSVTLRRGEGVEDVVPRSAIQELTSMGLSLMPEGLEDGIGPGEMADIIRYIRSPQER